jgi:hypothetical protein
VEEFEMALLDVIQSSLADYFRMRVQQKVHELVEPLSTEQVWKRPFRYGNSIGNLILHITGNLNYYIGAQIAKTGYIRHRDLEFGDSGKPKDELLKGFVRVLVGTSVALLLVGFTAYAGTSKTYELAQPVWLAGTEVAPGVYKLRWQEHTPEVTVTLLAGKRKVAVATGKWLERSLTYTSGDAFICQTGESRSTRVVEIRFAGRSQALVLDEAGAQSNSVVVPLCSPAKLGDETRSAAGGGCQHIRLLGTPTAPRRDLFPTDSYFGNSFPGWFKGWPHNANSAGRRD